MPSHANHIQIKICGISDEASLHAAVNAGANFIGFVHFAKSPRHVTLERAAELKQLLPAHVKSVVVTVNPDDALVDAIINIVAPDYIQLHGNESAMRIAEIHTKLNVIKAVPVAIPDDIIEMACDIVMFDAKPPKAAELPGGNGIAFDWTILKDFKTELPWMLSGGLNAENVQRAIQESGARMVDVSSGVESAPGKKDADKIKRFIAATRKP